MANVIKGADSKELERYLKEQRLTTEMQDKINKLRFFRGLEPIQFKDYIGATN